jgi:hypothetical protein
VSALERLHHADKGREMPHPIEKMRVDIGEGEFPMYHCAGMIKRNLRKDYAFSKKLMFGGEGSEYSNPIVRGKNTLSSSFVESCYRVISSSSVEGFTEINRRRFHKSCREAIDILEKLNELSQKMAYIGGFENCLDAINGRYDDLNK